jgi:photosystem II stability/assembly factor-like uncharacterized protein
MSRFKKMFNGRHLSFIARCGLSALGVALVAAPRLAAADALPPAPVAAPAVHAVNATQATMLASTRAGEPIVAVGDHGIVLLSDDGGKHHRQAKSNPLDVALNSVSFVDAKTGWAAGHWGAILHTQDGGETWTQQRGDVKQDRPLFAIHFFDANHGVAVGLWSLVLVTADGGKSWQTVEMPIPEGAKKADLNLLSLFGDDKGRIFAAAEKGMVLRSDDQGKHWVYLPTGYKGSFWTGLIAGDGSILAAGLRGSLYRSADDGRTWNRIDTHSKSSITGLANVGHEIVGVGLDGLVLRSVDAGASCRTEIRNDRISLTAITANGEGQPVLYSRQGVVAPDVATK